MLVVHVTFIRQVTISNLGGGWTVDGNGPATSFTFTVTPSSFGYGLTFSATADSAGTLTSTASMSVQNPQRADGSDASWAPETSTASAELN